MSKKTTKSGIEYEPYNAESALSIDGINAMEINLTQLQGHNLKLQEQNRTSQKDLAITQKALELSITDFWIEQVGKEPTDTQMKEDIKHYKELAQIELNRQSEKPKGR